MLRFVPLAVILLTLTASPKSASAQPMVSAGQVLSDDFNDNTIDALRWTTGQVGTGPTVAEANQRLEISIPGTSAETGAGSFGVWLISACQLRGDFDVQVDYQLVVWPASNGVRIGIGAGGGAMERTSLGTAADFPSSPWREWYITDIVGAGLNFAATSDLSGKLRLARTGATLTGYYYIGGIWVPVRSAPVTTADVPLTLAAWSHNYAFRDQAVRIAFDNFTVSQGQVVACLGDVIGSAILGCGGGTQPAVNVDVHLLDEGSPYQTVTTDQSGNYRFDDVPLGTYTLAIDSPPGFATAPDTRLVTLDHSELAVEPFVFTCLLSDVTGRVTASCNGQAAPLQGIPVDIYGDNGQGIDVLIATTATDGSGEFRFEDLALGDYTVGVVTPLGYAAPITSQPADLSIPDGSVDIPTFVLECQTIVSRPRGMGYWKHQINVYLTGKGSAEESLDDLLRYIDLMADHFNGNLVHPVSVYVPGSAATVDKLLQLQELLTVNRGGTTLDRARQQLLALLLNVVSFKISQSQVISDDGATVSQAITHSFDLIADGSSSNDDSAKSICESINSAQSVVAGLIPLGTSQIAYRRGMEAVSFRVTPNPGSAGREFRFVTAARGPVNLVLYDVSGRLVAEIFRGVMDGGAHSVRWGGRTSSGNSVARGLYFARLQTPRESPTIKVLQLTRE